MDDVSDLTTYKEAIFCSSQSNFWTDVMKDEMTSMSHNKVSNLVDFLNGYRPIRCRKVFKTKRDAKGQVKIYKARLMDKGYDSCHGRVSGINKICFLCSSYCRSQATAA